MKSLVVACIVCAGAFAQAYEYIHVCGTTDRHEQFFEKAKTQASASAMTLARCRNDSEQPEQCIKPICRRTYLPTKVSELPAASQARIRRYAATQAHESRQARTEAARAKARDEYNETHAGNISGGDTRTDLAGVTHYSDGTSSRRNITGAIEFSDGTTVSPGEIRTDILGDVHYGKKVCHHDIAGNTTCRDE